MARAIDASTGQVSDLLRPGARRSRFVPLINDYFGWTSYNRTLIESASDEQRADIELVVDMLLRRPHADDTNALVALLKAFRKHRQPIKS